MLDIRPVLYINGLLLLVLAVAMLVPAVVDVFQQDLDWQVFIASAIVTGLAGSALALGNRPSGRLNLNTRQAFLLTASSWILCSLFSAAPFFFSEMDMTLVDAVFEATSGITATGATVMSGLDDAPMGILLWRVLLHWLGGIGIIVMAVALLPILRIGGMQLFRMESSDKTEKVRPRVSQIASAIFIVYVLFTVVCAFAFYLAGMSGFDAICHAMSTISTGGFANSDSSMGLYQDPVIEWLSVIFMLAGGTTFILFITPWKHNRWALLWDMQVRWYISFTLFFSALMGLWLWANSDYSVHDAFRHATFNIVSVVTTTGFASTDYNAWGGFAQVIFFILTFIGGCTGSTAGGIKIFRYQVLFAQAGVHLKRLLHPHGVFVIDFNKQNISDAVVRSVLGFMVLYFLTFALLTLALSMLGLDFITALSGSATAISNVGPGLGETIGPAGNFQPLPDSAKWLLSFAMLLGRLELMTILVLLSPNFWRG
ncbi:TrkH family potassium uptake protein [Telmatospirillum sp. J64-1]|uniref:TrkH family potassium uptake protein n=1 Tax=Telmatospirillum sp. J64-1 TaxID=2502183 RepID=UPI00115D22C3|nr:TrkH family potassium uptake protein [Telmatospirillum sp. J64-1]